MFFFDLKLRNHGSVECGQTCCMLCTYVHIAYKPYKHTICIQNTEKVIYLYPQSFIYLFTKDKRGNCGLRLPYSYIFLLKKLNYRSSSSEFRRNFKLRCFKKCSQTLYSQKLHINATWNMKNLAKILNAVHATSVGEKYSLKSFYFSKQLIFYGFQ